MISISYRRIRVSMRTSRAAYERSVVRSSLRDRTLIMLSSLGEAFPRQLAVALQIDAWRLKAVMFGAPPDYSVALALVTLGLVEVRDTPHGLVYAITAAGRRKARQLTSRHARRARSRASEAEPQVLRAWPRPSENVAPPVATPEVDTSSFSWRI